MKASFRLATIAHLSRVVAIQHFEHGLQVIFLDPGILHQGPELQVAVEAGDPPWRCHCEVLVVFNIFAGIAII